MLTSKKPSLSRSLGTLAIQLGLLLLVGAFAGCAPQATQRSVVMSCELPSDQLGTLLAKWRATPVPLAFHQGDFSAAEMTEIMAAADTWNEFYGLSLAIPTILDYGDPSNPRTSTVARVDSNTACSQSIVSGNAYTGSIVIYKNPSWSYSTMSNVMAFTTRCRSPGTPLPYYFNSSIELNYRDFFVAGKKRPDLQTIILHEFGHLLGLDHSCEAGGKPGIPDCQASSLNPAYVEAIMFPAFGFDASGYGIRKRDLQENDQGRGNCLYTDFGG
ncbi:MAG: matrixin family metalloprotease [Oligoflexia bacterium]|nr:matrixin family metalloprotease [Oligoflexia bacterium]